MSGAHFSSLPAQVAERIEQAIREGLWKEWLPSERALTKELQISRKTLRKSLQHLQQTGWVEARHGTGYRILKASEICRRDRPVEADGRIVLLSPEPTDSLRSYTALWIAELAARLNRKEFKLEVVSGRKPFSRSPARELERIVRDRPAACWILTHSTEAMQRWFEKRKLPCVVSGSCHPGVTLPNVDHVYHAVCRHAAGTLIRLGHRRLVMLAPRSDRAGDRESEVGFWEGVRASTNPVSARVVRHSGEPDSVCRLLDELMRESEPPTALFVSDPLLYLTVTSHLTRRGFRIPADLSVMCRSDDRFLSFLRPLPARYEADAPRFARQLARPILALALGEPLTQAEVKIVVDFLEGESIGPVPRGSI